MEGGETYTYNYSRFLAKSNHANTHDLDTDDHLQCIPEFMSSLFGGINHNKQKRQCKQHL